MAPGGVALNTYRTRPKALGSNEPVTPQMTRFIIDFAEGQLAHFLKAPEQVQVEASVSAGRVLRTFIVPNPKTEGFRAGIDVEAPAGQAIDVRAFLKAGPRALTETWTHPFRPD
jgi:periplasmic glucans biosynthesis protein